VKSGDPTSGSGGEHPVPDTDRVTAPVTQTTQVDVPQPHPRVSVDPDAGLAAGTQLGRYLIIGRLGAGGMGVVYTAFDPELDRKVAIKFLKEARSRADHHRLLREAQALARLSHPNVVAVHDTGSYRERIFIALELVDGSTLKEWLKAAPRSWQEVVSALVAAGRGLAAAHRKDIIHRDFTPLNVLVGKDGRVAVTDFGLARPTSYPARDFDSYDSSDSLQSGSSELNTPLTQTGSVVGTPGYIAPEQYLGGVIDARSDIFSFAVTLYEALHGQRPFRGKGDELMAAVLRGKLEPPRGNKVPRRIEQILARALAVDPADRPASMDALLAELSRDPATTRRRVALALGAVLIAGASGVAFFSVGRGEDSTCRGFERALEGIWDPARKREVEAAFRASNKAFAGTAWQTVAATLDGYAGRWVSMRRDACEATRVRGEQTEAVLSVRMQCLDRRLGELAALARVLARADAQVVTGAVDAAAALRAVSSCGDVEALLAPVPLPDDPELRRRARELEGKLAEVKALLDAGRYQDALAAAAPALTEARALGHRPLVAEALELFGVALDRTGDLEGAVGALADAVWTGTASRHDEAASRAATRLTYVVGFEQEKTERGLEWARQAEAVLERMGRAEDAAFADLLMERGRAIYKSKDYPAALDHFSRAQALRARLLGERHHLTAQSLNSMGVVLKETGRFDEARAALERSLAISSETLGESHPVTSKAIANLGLLLDAQGNDLEAEKFQRRALAAREAALGPDHIEVSFVLANLASVLIDLGKHDEALELARRSLAIREKQTGPDSQHTAAGLSYVAQALRARGDTDGAVDYNQRALAILDKQGGNVDPNVGVMLSRLAEIAEERKQHAAALTHYRRVKEVYQASLGPEHPDLADPLTGIGRAELELGRAALALPLLEEALKRRLSVAGSIDPLLVADTRFTLARALRASRRDPERARTLAGEALADARRSSTERGKAVVQQIETWLRR
jgi:tetratricopeptide (TPR) repeat protein/tRNA A-37 threonylcarbamoyl transferase component Bud32